MAILAQYAFTGFVYTPTTEDANLAAGSVTNGSLYNFATSNNAYSTSPELTCVPQNSSTNLAGAVATSSYFYFTITPDANYHLDLTSLTFKGARGGTSTPRGYGLYSSIDSYASAISTADFTTQRTTWADFNISLTGGSYQELASAVTFRLYVYAPSNATSVEFDDITLNGAASLAHAAVVRSGLVAEYVGKYAKGSGTFGYQTQGATSASGWSDYKFGNPHTLSVDALVTKLTMYTTNVDTGHQACSARGVIYANNAGEPGAWIASTQDVSISDNLQAWTDFTFASPVHLTPGTYWLVCHGSATANGFDVRNTGSLSISRQNTDTFVGGAADPFGSSTYNGTRTHSIYATYTCAAPGNNSDPTSTWDDLVGGHDLTTATGFAWTTASGWRGAGTAGDPYCVQFDAVDSRFEANIGEVIDADGNFTLEAWVWWPSSPVTGDNNLVSFFHSVDGNPELGFRTSMTPNYYLQGVYCDGNNEGDAATSTVNARNAWHHVALTKSGTALQLYVDGATNGSATAGGATTAINSLVFGCSAWASVRTGFSDGRLATFRAYTRALSAAEVDQNYDSGILAASTDSAVAHRSSLIAFGIC